jgi:hypothetical protein
MIPDMSAALAESLAPVSSADPSTSANEPPPGEEEEGYGSEYEEDLEEEGSPEEEAASLPNPIGDLSAGLAESIAAPDEFRPDAQVQPIPQPDAPDEAQDASSEPNEDQTLPNPVGELAPDLAQAVAAPDPSDAALPNPVDEVAPELVQGAASGEPPADGNEEDSREAAVPEEPLPNLINDASPDLVQAVAEPDSGESLPNPIGEVAPEITQAVAAPDSEESGEVLPNSMNEVSSELAEAVGLPDSQESTDLPPNPANEGSPDLARDIPGSESDQGPEPPSDGADLPPDDPEAMLPPDDMSGFPGGTATDLPAPSGDADDEAKPEPEPEPEPEGEGEGDGGGGDDEAGMIVDDSFHDRTPLIMGRFGCDHSVSHLPPLVDDPARDAMNELLLDRFLKNGALPIPENRMSLVQFVQRQKVNAVCVSNFVEARRLQELSRRLLHAISSTTAHDYTQSRIDSVEEKLKDVTALIDGFHRETVELGRDLTKDQRNRRKDLDKHHEEELNQFEDKWNREEFLMRFAKPSSYLLQVKKIERSLVMAKDFEKAELYRKQVASLEKEESVLAQHRAEREMKIQHQKLLDKQQIEVEAFERTCEQQRLVFLHDRELLLEKLHARQLSLTNEVEMRKNSRETLPPLIPGRGHFVTQESAMTPRTIQRFAAYKTCVKTPKVVVKPLGVINKKHGNKRRAESMLDTV